jgi:hypothetical protein
MEGLIFGVVPQLFINDRRENKTLYILLKLIYVVIFGLKLLNLACQKMFYVGSKGHWFFLLLPLDMPVIIFLEGWLLHDAFLLD